MNTEEKKTEKKIDKKNSNEFTDEIFISRVLLMPLLIILTLSALMLTVSTEAPNTPKTPEPLDTPRTLGIIDTLNESEEPCSAPLSDVFTPISKGQLRICEIAPRAGIIGTGMPNYISLSIIGLILIFSIIIIIYLVSKLFNHQNGVSWAYHELYQVIATAVLFILLIFLFVTLEDVGMKNNPVDPIGETTLFESSYYYVVSMRNVLVESSVLLLVPQTLFSVYGSVNTNLFLFKVVGISIKYQSLYLPVEQGITWLSNLIYPFTLTWFGKEFLLCAVQNIVLPVFLPLGIIFRAFQPTRSIGGGLIALSLGLYFVYPLMLNINNLIMANHYNVPPTIIKSSADADLFRGRGYGGQVTLDIIHHTGIGLIGGMGMLTSFLLQVVPGIGGIFILLIMYLYVITYIKVIMFPAIIGSLILPIINILVTTSFIREFASFLGSDMSFDDLLQLL